MENFFKDADFYDDLSYYIECMWESDEQAIHELPDDWSDEVEVGAKERIFNFTIEDVVDFIMTHTDRWEDRFPEESDSIMKQIKKAIIPGIDIDKINSAMPYLYYPSKERVTITKQMLIDWIA